MSEHRTYESAGHVFDVWFDLDDCKARMKPKTPDVRAPYESADIEAATPEPNGSAVFHVVYTKKDGTKVDDGLYYTGGSFDEALRSVAYKMLPPIESTQKSCDAMARWMAKAARPSE